MRCKTGMEAANDCEVDLSLDLDLIEKMWLKIRLTKAKENYKEDEQSKVPKSSTRLPYGQGNQTKQESSIG